MKHKILKTVGTISIIATIVVPVFAAAKSKNLAVGSVTNDTLGVPPGVILPQNPFYGVTKAFGTMKEPFLTDKFSRLAAYEALLNRRGAELLKTYAVSPKNDKAVLAAMQEYQNQMYQYVFSLNRLIATGIVLSGENAPYGARIAVTVVRHARFIDDIAGWSYLTNAHLAVLNDLDDQLGTSAVAVITKVIGADEFLTLVNQGLSDQPFVEQIRAAEILSMIAKHAAARGDNTLAQKMLETRRDILASIAKNASPEDVVQISSIAGSRTERLQTVLLLLDTPELRGNQQLIDLKNQLLIQSF